MEDILIKIESRVWLICDVNETSAQWSALKKWLDDLKAQECGEHTYTFFYTFDSTKDSREQLQSEISNHFRPEESDRIYAIYRKAEGKYVGSFIFGQRLSD